MTQGLVLVLPTAGSGVGQENALGAPRPRARAASQEASAAWDEYSWVLLACLALVVIFVYPDYGISTDEEVQNTYGKMLLSFYRTGFQDLRAFSYKDLFYYGGFFDLVAAVLNLVSPLGEYETRHLLSGLMGVAGMAGTWKLARFLGGSRAGFLSVVLLALTGVYFGAMFNNTKDVPFAAAMVWSLYFASRLVAQFPQFRLITTLKFGAVLGLAFSLRVGAVMVGPSLLGGLLLAAWLAERASATNRTMGKTLWATLLRVLRAGVRLLPALPMAALVVALFWPWVVQSPLNLFKALAVFSHFPLRIHTLFNGVQVLSDAVPPSYLGVYIGVKLPETVLLGLIFALVFAAQRGWAQGWRALPAVVPFVPALLAVLLPMLAFVVVRPTIYNGLRHFLFLVPPLTVLAALGWSRLWERADGWHPRAGVAVAGVLALAGVAETRTLVALHPHEYVYYNAMAGGVQGAEGRFEMDYWGNSLREAALDLARYIELQNNDQPIRRTYGVVICGPSLAATHYFPRWLRQVRLEDGGDFFLSFTQDHGCDKIASGRPILEVERFGVPLSVVRDRRNLVEVSPPSRSARAEDHASVPLPVSAPAPASVSVR